METTQVKPPRAKTVINAIFCGFASSSDLNSGNGKTPVATSVTMLMPALANLNQQVSSRNIVYK